jgi:hypothetical protein
MLARRRDRSLDRTARAKTAGEGFLTKGKAPPIITAARLPRRGLTSRLTMLKREIFVAVPRNELCEMLPALLPEAHFRNPQRNAYI